jgi:hypothetical protein
MSQQHQSRQVQRTELGFAVNRLTALHDGPRIRADATNLVHLIQANLHVVIGKASFDKKALAENYGAALDEILRAKPSSSKGRYLKKVVVSTTTGPGIPVDPAVMRHFTEA